MPDNRREGVITRIDEACAGGRQAYWVYTLGEEFELPNSLKTFRGAKESRHQMRPAAVT